MRAIYDRPVRRAASSMLLAAALVIGVVGALAALGHAAADAPPRRREPDVLAATVDRPDHDDRADDHLDCNDHHDDDGDDRRTATERRPRRSASVTRSCLPRTSATSRRCARSVDAKSGRTLAEGVAAAAVSGADAGGTVVVHLGTNRWTQPAEVDALPRAVARGATDPDRQRAGAHDPRLGGAHQRLAGERRGRVRRCELVDWKGWSAAHQEWFQPDGIHPTDAGLQAYAALIEAAL